ncbi:MAG: hypothetical protein JWR42_2087 [Marmoricola sp.]|nr:hypothetical protein [Marmoricola sp.]
MMSSMWQGPEQLGKNCRLWVSHTRVDTRASDEQLCSDMVTWMDGHMSSRGGRWMSHGD